MAPKPVSAKQIRMLTMLQEEQAIARSAYENRGSKDNAHALKDKATRARLRYRSFYHAISGF